MNNIRKEELSQFRADIHARWKRGLMGLAALSGAFKSAGLGYKIRGNGALVVTMHGKGWGIPSARKLFDISAKDAENLFIWKSGVGANGERAIAKHIRKFVAGKISPP